MKMLKSLKQRTDLKTNSVTNLRCKAVVASILVGFLTAGCTSLASIAFFPASNAQKAADKVIDDIWPPQDVAKLAKDNAATNAAAPISPTSVQTGNAGK